MSDLIRRSDGMAKLAFECVMSEHRRVGNKEEETRKRLARAQEFPVILQRSGLTTALALYEAKGEDYRFVAKAVCAALADSNGEKLKGSLATCNLNTVRYLDLSERARRFSWWLKRASEANWSTTVSGPETAEIR